MKELKENILHDFWHIYETDGAIQAMSWLDSYKYYEDYCTSQESGTCGPHGTSDTDNSQYMCDATGLTDVTDVVYITKKFANM